MEAFRRGTIVIVKIYHKFYGVLITPGVVDHMVDDGLAAVWITLPNTGCQNCLEQQLLTLSVMTLTSTGYEFQASNFLEASSSMVLDNLKLPVYMPYSYRSSWNNANIYGLPAQDALENIARRYAQ